MTIFVLPDHETAVRGTARDLDVVAPGWYRRVDPATLNMPSLGRCVLGQVFGSYASGVSALGTHDYLDGRSVNRYHAHVVATSGSCSVGYWHREVAARLARDATATAGLADREFSAVAA